MEQIINLSLIDLVSILMLHEEGRNFVVVQGGYSDLAKSALLGPLEAKGSIKSH